jgi:hypothetical protein
VRTLHSGRVFALLTVLSPSCWVSGALQQVYPNITMHAAFQFCVCATPSLSPSVLSFQLLGTRFFKLNNTLMLLCSNHNCALKINQQVLNIYQAFFWLLSFVWNQQQFYLRYVWIWPLSRNLTKVEPYSICLFVAGLFHLSSRFIHVVAYVRISFFFKGWIIFHCMCGPHVVYLFTWHQTLGLLPPFGYCEYCFYEQLYNYLFGCLLTIFWGCILKRGIARSNDN